MGGPTSVLVAKSKASQLASFGKNLFVKAAGIKMASALGITPEDYNDSLFDTLGEDFGGNDGGFDWDSVPVKDVVSVGVAAAGLIRAEHMYHQSSLDNQVINEKLDRLLAKTERGEQIPSTIPNDSETVPSTILESILKDSSQQSSIVQESNLEQSLSLVIGQKIALEGVDKWSHLISVDAEPDVVPFLERTSAEEVALLEGLDIRFSSVTEIRHGLVYGDLLQDLSTRGSSLVKLLF